MSELDRMTMADRAAQQAARFHRLHEAVKALYYSAYWYPDREVDAVKLWTDVRDAAGLPPGTTKGILGEPRGSLDYGPVECGPNEHN